MLDDLYEASLLRNLAYSLYLSAFTARCAPASGPASLPATPRSARRPRTAHAIDLPQSRQTRTRPPPWTKSCVGSKKTHRRASRVVTDRAPLLERLTGSGAVCRQAPTSLHSTDRDIGLLVAALWVGSWRQVVGPGMVGAGEKVLLPQIDA